MGQPLAISAYPKNRTMVFAHSLETTTARSDRTPHAEVEISIGPRLQIKAEGMKTLGQFPVIVKVFKKISFPVLVKS